MSRIVDSAYAVMRGEVSAPKNAGLCLALTRVVIENAFGWPSHYLYRKYVTEWVQPDGYDRRNGHWARDAERSLRNLGMAVPIEARQPGDLVFNWRSAYSQKWDAYVGHVGVLIDGDMVLENVNPMFRPLSFSRGNTMLTPLRKWPMVSTVIHFVPREDH